MSNIEIDRDVLWMTHAHEEAARNQVDELVVQQIQPAFAKMRAMEGPEDQGPYLVAQGVSSLLFEAFRSFANVSYSNFEYDHTSQTVWYFGDPSEVHGCFNAWFPDLLKDKLMKILRESPLEPVPPEGATLGDQRSLAVELYRFINFDQPDDMGDGDDEENDLEVEHEPEEKALALREMLFEFSRSPAKPIEIPDEQISKKKEPDAILLTSGSWSSIYRPKTLVVLETAVWNETVSQLAEEVRVWKKNGSSVAIGFKINRRGPLNGFDPLIYLFVAYNVVEKVNGVIVTLTRHLQYNIGRLSGVKAIKGRCTALNPGDDLVRKRLDAIDNRGKQAGAYESVPGFTVISPTSRLIRIPLGSVLMEALDSQGYGHESPALLEYLWRQELVIDASLIRSQIISLCLTEEAGQRHTTAPGYADFIASQKLAGMSDAEAQRAWNLHLFELEDAQSAENAAVRLARAREVAVDAEVAARQRRPDSGVRIQQPPPAPARPTMVTRLMRRLNPE